MTPPVGATARNGQSRATVPAGRADPGGSLGPMNVERLDAARIAALFGLAWPAFFASVALAGLLLLVLWGEFPAPLLFGWLGAIVVLTAVRVGLQGAFRLAPGGRSQRGLAELF